MDETDVKTGAEEPRAEAEEITAEPRSPQSELPDEAMPAQDEPEAERELPPEAPAEQVPAEDDAQVKAAIEAIVYVTEEPATAAQIANALNLPEERVRRLIDELTGDFNAAGHGVAIREIAGGYKMATKPEYHESVRAFVKSLKPPLKLSLAALETLATIAYKQPITGPEIMDIRGVQGAGVLKTLLDRKLIRTAGRKNVIGRPILYRTSTEFLVQFGLKDLSELPTLKEFEELRRLAVGDDITAPAEAAPATEQPEVETPSEAKAPPEAETPEAAIAPESATTPGAETPPADEPNPENA